MGFESDGDAESGYHRSKHECIICLAAIDILAEMDHAPSGGPCHVKCKKAKIYLDDHARTMKAVYPMRRYQGREPWQYSYRLNDIIDSTRGRRGVVQQAMVQSFLTEIVEFEKTSYMRLVLYLSERAHKA